MVAASAAPPAFAASCTPLTGASFATWSGRISNDGLDYVQTYTPPSGGLAAPIEMRIAAAYTGFMKASEASTGPSLYDVHDPVGNTGKPGLGLIQAVTRRMDRPAPGRNARGAYTFSFTKPVSNLVLTFTDIDQTAGDFRDRAELDGPWTEMARGSGVSGAGTQASPRAGGAAYSDSSSGAGNVTVRFRSADELHPHLLECRDELERGRPEPGHLRHRPQLRLPALLSRRPEPGRPLPAVGADG